MIPISRTVPGHLMVLLAFVACGDQVRNPSVVIRDSAGVRIVENGPLSDGQIAFRLSEDPIYRIGWADGDYQFNGITSGGLLPDGSAVVGDRGSGQVIVLSAGGELRHVFGGKGEGPDEIGMLSSVRVLPPDTVVVEDDGNGRFMIFHDGFLVRSLRVEDAMAAYALISIGTDGRQGLLMTTSLVIEGFDEPWLQASIVRTDLVSGSINTITRFDFVQNDSETNGNPFAASGQVGVVGGAPFVGRNDKPEIKKLNPDGTVAMVIRWQDERLAYSDSIWTVFELVFRERTSLPRQRVEEILRDRKSGVGAPMPYFRRIVGDARGNAWVGEYSVDSRDRRRYQVFAPTGEWLGAVEMPPRLTIIDIGIDRLVGVQRNELDIEAVVLYGLERL